MSSTAPKESPNHEPDWLEGTRRGDPHAFAQLVRATTDALYRLACRVVGEPHLGADVLQNAYLKAFQQLRQGRFDGRSSVETWLYGIVLHTALNERRTRLRDERPHLAAAPHSHEAVEEAEARVMIRELFDWMKELPDEQCAALVLKELQGLTSREAAEVLGCTEAAVEQRLVRARATLRRRLDHD